jgi:catechol 2,3-dioxygenase-like lactoylglutathione lyase family enzyme
MINGLAHVCIAATDLAATERFYCSGLGLAKLFDFVRKGEKIGFYLTVSNSTYIEVFRQDTVDTDAKSPITHICFEVSDIDEAIARVRAEGYDATEKRLGADNSWQSWTADPSGVKIEFHQYTSASSQITGRNCVVDW